MQEWDRVSKWEEKRCRLARKTEITACHCQISAGVELHLAQVELAQKVFRKTGVLFLLKMKCLSSKEEVLEKLTKAPAEWTDSSNVNLASSLSGITSVL